MSENCVSSRVVLYRDTTGHDSILELLVQTPRFFWRWHVSINVAMCTFCFLPNCDGCHRSKPFACILILMFRKWFHSLTCGFKRFHFTSVSRFLESHGVQFRALHPPSWCLFELSFRMAWSLPRVFPTYFSKFWKFLCNLCHQDHEVNSSWSSSIIELRLLVFSFPVFVDSERFTIFFILLATRDHVWWSYELLSTSSQDTYVSLARFFFRESEFCEGRSTNLIDICSNRLSQSHQHVFLAWPCYINVFQWNKEWFFHRHVVELEVHCDDDRWSHLSSTKSQQAQASPSSVGSSRWDSPDSPWSSLLKSSLLA